MTGNDEVADPAVRALIAAINGGDRAAFFGALTPTWRTRTNQASRSVPARSSS